jgi:hypothetical protein
MADKLAEAFVEVRARLDHLEGDLKRGKQMATREVTGFQTHALGLARTATAAIATAAFAAMAAAVAGSVLILQQSVAAAAGSQEIASKFNVVFADNAVVIRKWGQEFASAVGRSNSTVEKFLASSQDLFVPLGVSADKAAELSKQVTQLAVDLGSFNNIADDQVLLDLQAALTGSGETMKKYGVIVNEAAVKQELLNMKLDPKTATNAEKAMARLNIIMAGTTAAQGDAIRTADSFTNQMKKLNATWDNFLGALGNELLPSLTPMITDISDSIRVMTGNIEDATVAMSAMGETSRETLRTILLIAAKQFDSVEGITLGKAARGGREAADDARRIRAALAKFEKTGEAAAAHPFGPGGPIGGFRRTVIVDKETIAKVRQELEELDRKVLSGQKAMTQLDKLATGEKKTRVQLLQEEWELQKKLNEQKQIDADRLGREQEERERRVAEIRERAGFGVVGDALPEVVLGRLKGEARQTARAFTGFLTKFFTDPSVGQSAVQQNALDQLSNARMPRRSLGEELKFRLLEGAGNFGRAFGGAIGDGLANAPKFQESQAGQRTGFLELSQKIQDQLFAADEKAKREAFEREMKEQAEKNKQANEDSAGFLKKVADWTTKVVSHGGTK